MPALLGYCLILLSLKIFSEKVRKKMSQTAARAAQVDKIKNQMMQVWDSKRKEERYKKSRLCTSYSGGGRFKKTLCLCRGHNQIKSGIIYY